MNEMYFSKEAVLNNELQDFLNLLLTQSHGEGDLYNDIHIYPEDLGAFIVEWEQLPWSHEYGGSFKYIDEDESVYKLFEFPDGHKEFLDPLEINDTLDNWFKENPGWKTSHLGN